MSNKARGRLNQLREINQHAGGGTQAPEIEQPVRDRLAAKSFVANQTEIFSQVLGFGRVVEGAFFDSLLQTFGASGDGGQRIIDLMDDAGGQAANGGEFFSARHGAFGLDARGYIFTDRGDMWPLLVLVPQHWDLPQ